MSLKIDHAPAIEQLSEDTRNQLFSMLKPEDIEQFYMAYQLWSQQQQVKHLQLQMLAIEHKISENAAQMEQIQPSPIALAALVQLQACGVEDLDLLDRMLERGDEWLDNSLQLLERCEELDLIGGNYTQWCEHAMEGAYEWMNSISDPNINEVEIQSADFTTTGQDSTMEDENKVTEAQLLRKLMDADEELEETGQAATLSRIPRITQPLTMADAHEDIHDDTTTKRTAVQPLKQPRITQPLIPTNEHTSIEHDTTTKSTAVKSLKQPHITQPLVSTDEHTFIEHNAKQPTILEPAQNTDPTQTLITADEQIESSSPTATATETDQEHDTTSHNLDTIAINPLINSENEVSTQDTNESVHEIAPLPVDNSNDAIYLANEVTTTEQIDQAKSLHTTLNMPDEKEPQDDIQPENLQQQKKLAHKKRRGFFHWLFAKIVRR